jgi:hypothetical protein
VTSVVNRERNKLPLAITVLHKAFSVLCSVRHIAQMVSELINTYPNRVGILQSDAVCCHPDLLLQHAQTFAAVRIRLILFSLS